MTQGNAAKQQEIQARYRRAEEALRANNPEAAEREFQASVDLDPNDVNARANLGSIEFLRGDYARAARSFRGALTLQPSLWKAQCLLGMCENRLGNLREARSLLGKSFPHLQDPKLRLRAGMELIEIDYATGHVESAVDVVGILQRVDPTNVDVLYAAYRTYSDLASRARDALALIAPDSARMHEIMAEHLINEGDLQDAIVQYRRVLKIDPKLPGVHYELGEAILKDSVSEPSLNAAKKELESELAIDPDSTRAECKLGEVYFLQSNLKLSFEHYSRALTLNPSNVDAHVGLSEVLTRMGQPQKALEHLIEASRLAPFNAVARYRLAMIYRKLGNEADADREMAVYKKIEHSKERERQVYEKMHEWHGTQHAPALNTPR